MQQVLFVQRLAVTLARPEDGLDPRDFFTVHWPAMGLPALLVFGAPKCVWGIESLKY